jgi:16S rRNA (guanine966-N2)-methyltransferase
MRITGGKGRGTRLRVPAGDRVRPTADKVKQALFNILGEQVRDAVFLDLYAGTGGIGI